MTSKGEKANGADLSQIFLKVTSVYFKLSAQMDLALKPFGLTGSRMGVLRTLYDLGPATVSDIARMRPVSRQGVQRLSKELTSSGLTRLTASPDDGRSKILELTPKGRRLYERAAEMRLEMLDELATEYSAVELNRLMSTLDQIEETVLRIEPT
ncbi:MarR family transcriptional regulator [Parvibaculaceae bacterium PLY_AMNH_Bact1]|nr:MarR family transcriptional regulator [Parvibaculaceae bacterium PLY_AMNH_Bact1]